jgi:uncharacterized protein (TIGR03435 family)
MMFHPCRSRVSERLFSAKIRHRGDVRRAHDEEQLPHLLQSLLEERLDLSIHRELKEQPVYDLIVGKGGSKLHETTHESEEAGLRQVGHSFTFINATMANLVGVLSQVAGRKALDRTGENTAKPRQMDFRRDRSYRKRSPAPPY